MLQTNENYLNGNVAPRVGAWIETLNDLWVIAGSPSHPVWVRGLKLEYAQYLDSRKASHPVWVRGLKHEEQRMKDINTMSHPVWVRGLKHAESRQP